MLEWRGQRKNFVVWEQFYYRSLTSGDLAFILLSEVEMRKGYRWGRRIEENQDNPRLKSICGDNIKYPRVKKATQMEEYSQSDCLVA